MKTLTSHVSYRLFTVVTDFGTDLSLPTSLATASSTSATEGRQESMPNVVQDDERAFHEVIRLYLVYFKFNFTSLENWIFVLALARSTGKRKKFNLYRYICDRSILRLTRIVVSN